MRQPVGLALLLVLALAACADTVEPPSTATAPPTTTPSAPSSVEPVLPTSSPEPMATLSAMPTGSLPKGPPWPSFVRELDFGIAAGNSYGPQALALHPELDWIYARTRNQQATGAGQITILSRTTGQVLARAETGLDTYGEGDLVLDPQEDRLYTVNADEDSASILDALTLEILHTLEGVSRLALDSRAGRLYIAGLGGLRSVDTEDYRILHETNVAYAPRFLAVAVEPMAGRVYLAWQENGDHYLAQYDAETLEKRVVSPLPGPPNDLVSDPGRPLVYLTLSDGERNLLWAIDERGQLAAERVLGEWSQTTRLALDPNADVLFLGRDHYSQYSITLLDLQDWQETSEIPLDLAPNTLLWDSGSSQLLVGHTYAHKIRIVDTQAGETAAMYPTALDLVDLAVDPQRGHLYVTNSAGSLHILNSENNETLAVLPGEGFIAVDGPHGRLYTGGRGSEHVRVYDADALQQTGQIETEAKPVADAHSGGLYLVQNGIYIADLDTLTITGILSDTLPRANGYSPNPSAVDAVVDAGSGRLFAIINNGVPGSNSGTYLYVYEPITLERILTDTERSPTHLDIDPTTGRAYVSRIHLAGRSTSVLENGYEYKARLEAVFGAVRVDPGLNRLYLSVSGSEEGHLLVLDARNLDVLGSVPIPGGFALHALDSHRHLLYLTGTDGRVQIWSATGASQAEPQEPILERPATAEISQLFLGPQDVPIFTGSLYRSDNLGGSWQRIDAGLPRRGTQHLAVSPSFPEDYALFAALKATDEGLGIWKSLDGGRSWRMTNRGLSDLAVTDLAISPSYTQDLTLFATSRKGGLYRSEDGGESWVQLTGLYCPGDAHPQPPTGVFLSPTYGRIITADGSQAGTQDRTLFVAHDGLYRSKDGGETWQSMNLSLSSLAFSPNFARDQTVFGWTGQGGLFRSTDGGDSWQPASAGLALNGYGWGHVIVSPDFPTSQTLYFVWSPTAPDTTAQFFRSRDAAHHWEQLTGQVPEGATPVELSADGSRFLALDKHAQLTTWTIEELDWRAITRPSMDDIELYDLVLSPDFPDNRTLFGLSEGAGILRSADAGATWDDTGFPLRGTSGLPLRLTLVPPERLFVGTPLGLYLSLDGATWLPAEGGLPKGVPVTTPQLGRDGSLRVLTGDASDPEPQRIYHSTDGGQTWITAIPALPQAAILEDLQLSPDFGRDLTAFLAPSPGKPWRTKGSTEWEVFGPPGEWELSSLQVSPSFGHDRLLFMRLQDNSLWKSTDGGDSWSRIDPPWGGEAPIAVTQSSGYRLDALTLSPTFAQDGVILTQAGSALYRSVEEGGSWNRVLALAPGTTRAAFSPDYLQDGVIYLLQGSSLYRSTDRGQTWETLPPVPWSGADAVELLLSPTFPSDDTLLTWTTSGQVYQSQTGGQSWSDISRGLPTMGIRQVTFSPTHARDELLYLVPAGPGLFTLVGSSSWISSGARRPKVTPTPEPRITPTPRPANTPEPEVCPLQPELIQGVWDQIRPQLGCPEEPATARTLAEQAFEHGRMIWDSVTKEILVLMDTNRWLAVDDTFEERVDPAYDPALPLPPKQPQRGFGKVWREQLGGAQAAIGWALEDERPVNGYQQPFQRGYVYWTSAVAPGATAEGTAYLLYENGTWQSISVPGP